MSCNDALEIIESGDGLEIIINKTESVFNDNETALELVCDKGQVTEIENGAFDLELTQEIIDLSISEQIVELEIIEQLIINNPDIDPPTENADSITDVYEADESILARKVVYIRANGRIAHADKDAAIDFKDVLGVSATSGAAGQDITVVKFGKLTGAAIGAIGSSYFLGNNGDLIAIAPISGNLLEVATQDASDTINVKLGTRIKRG